jgi:hypothetical protein
MPLPQHLDTEGLAVSPNEVWLGAVRGSDRLILRFPKEAFLQVPRERWVPAEVPKEDVQTRLATWTPHQQALYHVFAGNHATAINLLQAEVQSEPRAEPLFLLALAHDELGAAQPDKARAYADQLIASHPESVLAVALQFERRRELLAERIKERRQRSIGERSGSPAGSAVDTNTVPDRIRLLMDDYDVDGDGALNASELSLYCELEPESSPAGGRAGPINYEDIARSLLARWDVNRDGLLQTNELAPMLKSPPSMPMGRVPRPRSVPPGVRSPVQPTTPP